MRLGDLDALEKTITEEFHGISATGFIRFMRDKTPVDVYNRVQDLIDNAPTIEVRDNFDVGYVQGLEDGRKERPQGEWVLDKEHSITMDFYKCTNCNYFGGATHYNFCPNCGAKMQKGETEE